MVAKVTPLVVIVGPTASGKSDLAMYLAKKFNGEIIAADSRTVYRGMDIGTAKPSKTDQETIKHHLLDIVDPDQQYNAMMFKKDASKAIESISSRGKLPIMVGGTGLYVNAVIFDYDFDNKTKGNIRPNTLVIGVDKDKDELKMIIRNRADAMFENGLIEEVKRITDKYGWDNDSMTGIGYRAMREYLEGRMLLDELKQKIARESILFAKRQRTWFKPNKSIQWLSDPSKAVAITTTFLNNLSN